MKEAVVLTRSDVRKILAQWYGVEEKDVLPSKFSFTVIKEADAIKKTEETSPEA